MARTAKGSKAYGFCDRTGFRYPLADLVPQIENRKPSGLMVGKDVVDIDHEQLQLGRVKANDPQSLDDPRPEQTLSNSRYLWAWAPVGGGLTEFGSRTVGLGNEAQIGKVSIE